jgi:hypothetical protein
VSWDEERIVTLETRADRIDICLAGEVGPGGRRSGGMMDDVKEIKAGQTVIRAEVQALRKDVNSRLKVSLSKRAWAFVTAVSVALITALSVIGAALLGG